MVLEFMRAVDDGNPVLPSIVESVIQALLGRYVESGGEITPSSSDMTVTVSAGSVNYNGSSYNFSSSQVTIPTPSQYDRYDVIVWKYNNESPTILLKQGQQAVSDGEYAIYKSERLESDEIPLAVVYVPTNATVASDCSYYDVRSGRNVDWSIILNKPSTYPPSSHVHNVGDITFNDTILPSSGSSYDIGSTSYKWKDLWLSGNAYVGDKISIGTNSVKANRVTISGNILEGIQSPDVTLDTNEWFNIGHSSGYGYIASLIKGDSSSNTWVSTHSSIAGALIRFEMGSIFLGIGTSAGVGNPANVVDVAIVNSNGVQPGVDNVYNLGSSSYRWKNGYFSGTVYASKFVGETNKYVNLAFDDTYTSVYGTTETEIKTFRFAKDLNIMTLSKIYVIASLWGNGGTAKLRVYIDGTNKLELTTTSTSETVVSGTIDASSLSNGMHTVSIRLLNSSSSNYTYNQYLNVVGEVS